MFVLPTSSCAYTYRTMLHRFLFSHARFSRAQHLRCTAMHHPRRKDEGIVVGPGDGGRAFFSSPATKMKRLGGSDVAYRRIDFDFDGTPATVSASSSSSSSSDGGNNSGPLLSFGRECEDALNGQIAREYELSLLYHSLACRYANKALNLPGLSKMFLEESDEERKHAQAIMDYVNTRGGNVRLRCLSVPSDPSLTASPSPSPSSPFPSMISTGETSGGDFLDALHGLRTAHAAENENLVAIRALYELAEKQGDVPLADWIAENLLREQVASVSRQYDLLMRLRRSGPGIGLDVFDGSLLIDRPFSSL